MSRAVHLLDFAGLVTQAVASSPEGNQKMKPNSSSELKQFTRSGSEVARLTSFWNARGVRYYRKSCRFIEMPQSDGDS